MERKRAATEGTSDSEETLESPDPLVYVWPRPEDEPLTAPQSVVLDSAIRVAVERFPNLTELNVLSPSRHRDAVDAHQLMLALLDGTSIDYEVLAAELGYKSEEDLEDCLDIARERIKQNLYLENVFAILQIKYSRVLKEWLVAQVPPETPPNITSPALSKEQQELFKRFRANEEDTEAVALLEQRYDSVIEEVIDSYGTTVPAEIIDTAWKVFDRLVKNTDLNSPTDFGDILRQEIHNEITRLIEAHRIAKLTENLDIRDFYRELEVFDNSLGKRQIKSSVDPAAIENVLASARTVIDSRLSKDTEQPIQGFFRIPPERRPWVAQRIRVAYEKAVTRRLKASAIMAERGLKEFQLAQLPDELLNKFLSMTADTVAHAEINRVKQHQRRQ